MKLRLLTALAACCALAMLCACKEKEVNANAPPQTDITQDLTPAVENAELTLAYSDKEGLNPYISQSNTSLLLSDLLYEKMLVQAPDMSLQMRAVKDVVISGLDVSLYPDTGYTYMDGVTVSTEDIAASLEAARTSALYRAQLANIETIEPIDGSVKVKLFAPDSMFAYLLCLPVLKASETAAAQPTASGRYYFGNNSLLRNDASQNASAAIPSEIKLKSVSSFDEISSALGMGEISLYATEQENNASATTTSLQSFYKMNNLVFIGINALKGESSALSHADARRAISMMIDRQLIADKCYYSRAYPAQGAINSLYPCVNAQQVITATADLPAAEALLTALGYNKDALDGYYNKDNKRLELDLLVYSKSTYKRYSASLIKEHLDQNGVYVNLVETDNFDVYTQKIQAGEFDMYIGEIKMYNNMDLAPFLSGGAAGSGIVMSEELKAAYAAFKDNASFAPAFEKAFSSEMPYVPLLWRCGSLVTTKNVHGIVPSMSDIFYNMNDLVCTQKAPD